MAVTPTGLAADTRAARVLTSLHEVMEAPVPADGYLDEEIRGSGAANRTWLDLTAELAARHNPPGTVVTLPCGSPYIKVTVTVPEGT